MKSKEALPPAEREALADLDDAVTLATQGCEWSRIVADSLDARAKEALDTGELRDKFDAHFLDVVVNRIRQHRASRIPPDRRGDVTAARGVFEAAMVCAENTFRGTPHPSKPNPFESVADVLRESRHRVVAATLAGGDVERAIGAVQVAEANVKGLRANNEHAPFVTELGACADACERLVDALRWRAGNTSTA